MNAARCRARGQPALWALALLAASCGPNRLVETKPKIGAVLIALGEGDGVDVRIDAPFSTGDPLHDMSVDAYARHVADGLAARVDVAAPTMVVEDAVVAVLRAELAESFGAAVVARAADPHDAVFAVTLSRYGLHASDPRAPLSWYVELRGALTYVPERAVVWSDSVRVDVPATPAAVVGGRAGVDVVADLGDEQIHDVVVGLSERAARALLRKLRAAAR